MRLTKLNSEGYYELISYDAFRKIIDKNNIKSNRPLVFICSPFAGDTEFNISRAKRYCRFALHKKCIPFAPHILFPQFMDDDDKEQRELGILFGLVIMSKCQEVWVFGSNISKGMEIEIKKAKDRKIPIRYFNEQCEEVGMA